LNWTTRSVPSGTAGPYRRDNAAVRSGVLHHFSEDPAIERFIPHVPPSNPTQAPAVWAIDAEHAPLYWFPRDCPRVTVWPRSEAERPGYEAAFATPAPRIHVIEVAWLERIRTVELYRYDLPADTFQPWEEAFGQFISQVDVVPLSVRPVGDLLAAHERAGIELRAVESLWPVRALAISHDWNFSIVRMANAQPPPEVADPGHGGPRATTRRR
jgi:hypothetical protein